MSLLKEARYRFICIWYTYATINVFGANRQVLSQVIKEGGEEANRVHKLNCPHYFVEGKIMLKRITSLQSWLGRGE